METAKYLYGIVLLFVVNVLSISAQTDYDTARCVDTICYYVINPEGDQSEFTWTLSGGTIIGHSSPYTALGADSVWVIWDDANRISANFGSLTVSKRVLWPEGSSCPGQESEIIVESWAQPTAKTDTAMISVCPAESFSIRVEFEGKPPYRYKWKLYEKENPEIIVENHTDTYLESLNPFIDIIIPPIETGSSPEVFGFEITDVRDALEDDTPGNTLMARKSIQVLPKPVTGTLESNNPLIRR